MTTHTALSSGFSLSLSVTDQDQAEAPRRSRQRVLKEIKTWTAMWADPSAGQRAKAMAEQELERLRKELAG